MRIDTSLLDMHAHRSEQADSTSLTSQRTTPVTPFYRSRTFVIEIVELGPLAYAEELLNLAIRGYPLASTLGRIWGQKIFPDPMHKCS